MTTRVVLTAMLMAVLATDSDGFASSGIDSGGFDGFDGGGFDSF